jgi:hypothetical protein
MPVITVSRQRGSLGSYIALEVAQRLGLQYLDREILDSVAREAGVPVREVEAIEERAGRLSRMMYLLGARPRLPVVASASLREQEDLEARIATLMETEDLTREGAIARLQSGSGVEYAPRSDYLDLLTSVIAEYAARGRGDDRGPRRSDDLAQAAWCAARADSSPI